MLVSIIREICREENIGLAAFSYDWILRLEKGGKAGFVFGYNFSVNNTASARICDDKSAAAEILLHAGIPAAEHIFFMAPGNQHYTGENGSWPRITKLLAEHGTLVCKANEGTGGNAVFLVKNQAQLEAAAHSIFSRNRSMAVSPYCDIQKEYRVIVLNGEVKLAYAKNIPFVTGDGKSNLRQLLLEYMSAKRQLVNTEFDDEALEKIPAPGELCGINWKSNLGQGASPEAVRDETLLAALSDLALLAAAALSIDFASVDIVKTPGGLKVLEVNCGIMMENFIRFAPENYNTAKEIYREAVWKMMKYGNLS